MVLTLRKGVNAKIEDPFLIFKNKNPNHPMINLTDDIPGISLNRQPRSWMDDHFFVEWVKESGATCQDSHNRLRTLIFGQFLGA